MALKYGSSSREEAIFIRSTGFGYSTVVYTVPAGARLEGIIYPAAAGAVAVNVNGADNTMYNDNQGCSVTFPSGTVLRNTASAFWTFSGKLVWG